MISNHSFECKSSHKCSLRENWYDSPESLIGLSDADYEKMKIPYRVVTAIREELSTEQKPAKTNAKNK